MYLLKTEATFDSAHFLRGYNGKCANLHGHTWRVEVTVGSDTLTASGEQRGMVIDFADLKKAVRNLADRFDHTLIYESGSLRDATRRRFPCAPPPNTLPPISIKSWRSACLSDASPYMRRPKTVLCMRRTDHAVCSGTICEY